MPAISSKTISTVNIWLERLLVILLLDYILLFGWESILPGFVMDVFNLNYLLLVIVAILLYLSFSPAARPAEAGKQEKKNTFGVAAIAVGLILFLGVIAIFSLYKLPFSQMALYIGLAVVSSVAVYKTLEKV